MIEDRALDDEGLDTIAARLGVTGRHLRRAFGAEFGVSPVRVCADAAPAARQAPADGHRSAGYRGGLRQRLRQPAALQRAVQGALPPPTRPLAPPHARCGNGSAGRGCSEIRLSFRPPYDWAAVSAFLGARAIAGVESVDGARYRRTVRVAVAGAEHRGWIEVTLSPGKPALRVARLRVARERAAARAVAREVAVGSGLPPCRGRTGARRARTTQRRSARSRRLRRLRGGGARDPRPAGYRRCRAHDRWPVRCGVRRADRNTGSQP